MRKKQRRRRISSDGKDDARRGKRRNTTNLVVVKRVLHLSDDREVSGRSSVSLSRSELKGKRGRDQRRDATKGTESENELEPEGDSRALRNEADATYEENVDNRNHSVSEVGIVECFKLLVERSCGSLRGSV